MSNVAILPPDATDTETGRTFTLCEELDEIGRFWAGDLDDEGRWIPGFGGDGEAVRALIEHRRNCLACLSNFEFIEERRRRLARKAEPDESEWRKPMVIEPEEQPENGRLTGAILAKF